ncbi:MAG TPA: glutathionylspermidine synthase family protein [Candidatus Elarobacter sp.]
MASAADAVAFWDSYEGHHYALPDAVVLEAADVDAVRAAARGAWAIYERVAPLVRALPDEGLAALGIPAPAYGVVRLRDERAGETLVARFDFLREDGEYRVVELNAETPFFMVESFVENGVRARAAGLRDPNDGERAQLGAAIAAALEPLAGGARIGVVATNVYREDAGTACFLRDLIAEHVDAEVAFVPVHELAVIDGVACDADGPLDVLYRCYPLEHIAADRDGPALFDAVARGACRLLNPPSALALQSKATQALIWGLYERGELFDAGERATIARAFLPTYLDRPDDGGTYVRKPVLGREGIGVTVLDADGREIARGERAPRAYGEQPAVYQRFVRAPRRRVRRADGVAIDGEELMTCFVAGGRPSAVGMRIGGPVIDAWSHFAPVGSP